MKSFIFLYLMVLFPPKAFSTAQVKFGFDHTYISTTDHSIIKNLESRGFAIRDKTVKHPGGYECKFINFEGGLKKVGQYLEVCAIYDQKEANKSISKYHKSIRERKKWGTGLSLNASGGLDSLFKAKKDEFSDLGVRFYHKNYDWKKDSVSRLPGWNFLSFDHQELIQGLYTWVTEYEKKAKKKSKSKKKKKWIHKNGSEKIIGAILYGEYRPDLRDFSSFLGITHNKNQVRLHDGVKIFSYSAKELPEYKDIFIGKKQLMGAMIIKVKSLKKFNQIARPDRKNLSFQGQSASLIKLGDWHWDLLFVEKEI